MRELKHEEVYKGPSEAEATQEAGRLSAFAYFSLGKRNPPLCRKSESRGAAETRVPASEATLVWNAFAISYRGNGGRLHPSRLSRMP